MKRKEIWIKLIFFLIVFSLFSYNFINYNNNLQYKIKTNYLGESYLKSSDNEISIVSPENKTYNEPMRGYYPATYGFENDFIGHNPSGWEINENPPTYDFEIVKEKNGHKHVVHIDDNEIGGYRMRYFPDSDIEIGTIELWVLGADVSDRSLEIASLDNSSITGITLRLHTDGWYYYGDYGDQLISNSSIPQDNQWHHIRLDFRCSGAVDYMGLTESSYRVYIDGINLGDLSFCEPFFDKLNSFKITTDNISDSEWWVDAIGFSWDPNYNIRDNLHEGLVLSFDISTTLDWMGYSLDGLSNKTILGNTTFPLPANGAHNIQVFGNDSLGAIYASNLRYFTLDAPIININTPENKTYTEPMSGYYPATYGFENDEKGIIPKDWSFFTETNGFTQVVEGKGGHNKVLELQDTGSGYSKVNNTFSNQTDGTIEFYIYIDYPHNSGDHLMIQIHDQTPEDTIVISWMNNDLDIYDGTTLTTVGSYNAYTWYHVRLQFDCSDNWHLWIDGISVDGGIGFNFRRNTTTSITEFDMRSWSDNRLNYIDAVSYSWDLNYNIGDNLNEGLLISFNNGNSLDWMGYSLDGLANKTIFGDTTIPFLGDGSHSIQVFGNDSLGTIYESEIRYFSINAPPPSISIITPSNDNFYSDIAPSFSISIIAFSKITTWYTLEYGGTNTTFTGSSGTINQTEWDDQGEGPITIRFYANDSFGRLNYAEISINKDITDPVITINSPSLGDQFTTMPPRFNISVDELNIDAMWYTLDGGSTTYNISEYSGYIDSIAWNAAPEGAIKIGFYVRDKAGNEDYEEVIIQKSSPPYIPPDNSLIIIIGVTVGASSILIGFSLILYIILRRKRKYEPSKFKELKKPEIRVKTISESFMCPYCHNENDIKHRYCIYCGSSLVDFKPNNI